jgi:hypothetical protein
MRAQLHARYVICSTSTLPRSLAEPLLQVHSNSPPSRLRDRLLLSLVSFRRPSVCYLSFRFVDCLFALSRFVASTVRLLSLVSFRRSSVPLLRGLAGCFPCLVYLSICLSLYIYVCAIHACSAVCCADFALLGRFFAVAR